MSGSIWNPNSWHWEERNHDRWSREFLERNLKAALATVEELNFTLEDLTFDGHAAVSVRKAKQIVTFDYNISGNWKASLKADGDSDPREAKGTLSIHEFSLESVEDEDYNIDFKFDDASREHEDKLKPSLLEIKNVLIKQVLQPFPKQLLDYDVEHVKSKTMQQQNESKNNIANVVERQVVNVEQHPIAVTPGSNEGVGSVWNPNSYHWEEKTMTSWARETLVQRIQEAKIQLPDNEATATFSNVQVEGEAAISIRKRKKIFYYDLALSADVTATGPQPSDEEARKEASATLKSLNLNSTDLENGEDVELEIKVNELESSNDLFSTTNIIECEARVKDIISGFLQDLRQK